MSTARTPEPITSHVSLKRAAPEGSYLAGG
jgi:hypothetical protein